jgi:aerobic carbon-monoxide dehydrogenase medium subunit
MQVPAPFEYERASSVDEAIALLERHGEEARLIAGGHSLLPLMKLRLASPEVLVDINDLTDLQRIWVEDNLLRIGAMVRHADLLASAVVGEHYRILHDAERVIADPVVRNRGTIGGSLCHADPAEDLSAALGAIRAEVVIVARAASESCLCASFRQAHSRRSLARPRSPPRSGCRSRQAQEVRTPRWNVAPVTMR